MAARGADPRAVQTAGLMVDCWVVNLVAMLEVKLVCYWAAELARYWGLLTERCLAGLQMCTLFKQFKNEVYTSPVG